MDRLLKNYQLQTLFYCFQVLGVDSEFCNVEALVTGIVDNWPNTLMKHRRLFTVGLCLFMFCAGLPMCTEVFINFIFLVVVKNWIV